VAASRIRILVQNVFGSTELPITAATIAYPSDGEAGVGSIDESSLRTLTFGGANSTTIAAGDKGYTDPIDFPVMSQSIVTVSLYFKDGQSGLNITGHPGNRVTSWMGDGDLTHASNVTGANVLHWYFVTAIEAWEPSDYYTWAILGDSITDGRESTNDENNRWPDRVLARLQASPDKALNRIGLANEAAGGNAILIASDGLGPALITRYKRDAIEQPGIRWVTIFEGVNDIGVAAENNATLTSIGDQLIQAYTQIAGDCHAAGLKVSAATITPFSGSRLNYTNPYANPIREAERIRINNVSCPHMQVADPLHMC
jgi:lysophospholipase L1-like esterase